MNSAVRLQLLGTPAVEFGGRSLALAPERRTQLLALLALRRGWVQRAELAALLWPDQESRLANANLRKTLFRLQQLPWALGLQTEGSALRWDVGTDVAELEAALASPVDGAAAALWRGELLAGFDDGSSETWTRWLAFERERLRNAWRAAVLAQLAAEPAPAQALALTTRLLEADPLDEVALREHVAALARDGQAAAARQAGQRFAERLQQELGIEPGIELRALLDGLAPPAGAAPRPPVALPPPPTTAADDGFVGRGPELQRITQLLTGGECRLLCLVGPGGIGKTRLARRAMAELAGRFAGGAVFVQLEDVSAPAQFGTRLVQALAPDRGRGGRDPIAQAVASIGSDERLLVLDNFEALAEHAAALLDRLLQGCSGLRLLVTSRVRLGVPGEWSLPLEGLPVPDPEDDDRAEAFDAVRLFVKAARRIEPMLDLAAERAAIVDICRQVEGLPLALELAAAWVRLLPCGTIAAELRQGSELLSAYDPTQPPRHASVELVFEQSWLRLSAAERDALARLAVFRGGFAADAVRAIAGASLPVLAALVDKSLLRKDGPRLSLHPLLQQLARARLGEGEALAATQAAHAEYFLRWLARLGPAIERADRDALQQVDTEIDNCREAWANAVRLGHGERVAGALRALQNYCDLRGRFEDGLTLVREALALPSAEAALQVRLMACAAHFEYRLDRYAEAEQGAARVLAELRHLRDGEAQLRAIAVQAGVALRTGRLADAQRLYRRILALAAGAESHDREAAGTLDNLALVEKRLGHYDEALALTLQSLATHRRLADSAGIALCLNNLASTYMVRQDWDAAAPHLQEALAICDRDGLASTLCYVLANLAEVSLQRGELDAAVGHSSRGIESAQVIGNRAVGSWMRLQRSRIAARLGDLAAARADLAEGVAAVVALGITPLRPGALLTFAELLEAGGDHDAARRVIGFAADHPSTSAMDRDELRAHWATRPTPRDPDPPWPGITLDELLQRITAERHVEHAPLLAALRIGG